MPVFQEYRSLDEYFMSASRKILLNDMDYWSTDPIEFSKQLYTEYEDEISLLPQCECGYLKGGWKLGKKCPECGTEVTERMENLQPLYWLKKVKEDLPFINPVFWKQLGDLINSKIDAMKWLSDTSYHVPKVPPILKSIAAVLKNDEYPQGRGYKNVLNNIETILIFLINNSAIKNSGKVKSAEELLEFWKRNKSKLINDYLPIFPKYLFVVERTNKADYTTLHTPEIIDLSRMCIKYANLAKEDKEGRRRKTIENMTAKIISQTAQLFTSYLKDFVAGKKGLMRKQIYGTRQHFTGRPVLVSLPSNTDYNEIWVPWKFGPTLYRPHLLNMMIKRLGMKYNEASQRLFKAENKYDPLIDELLQTMIKESKHKGLPVLISRNPSLKQSSILLVYITKFKTDDKDNTMGINFEIMAMPNADVDGDQMNVFPLHDDFMFERFKVFDPHFNILDLDLFKVNKWLYIAPPTIATMSNYLREQEPEKKDCEVYKKLLTISGEKYS